MDRARATPTSLRRPWDSWPGIRPATSSRPHASMAQATFSLRRVRGGATRSRSTDHADGCSAATRRFSSTVRSSNSSTDWNVRISPRRAIA